MTMPTIFKRILCAALAFILLCPSTSSAAQPLSISITDTEAEAGRRAEVEIFVSGSSGISGAALSIDYDREALKLVEIRPLAGGLFTADPESGSFSWLRGSDLYGDFALAALVFDISSGAEGEFEIALSLTGDNEGNLTDQRAEAVEAHLLSGKLTVSPLCPSDFFSDLHSSAWYHEAIDFVLDMGLMRGVGGNFFAPNITADRAMVVTTLHRMAGSPPAEGGSPYTDAPEGRWYSEALAWAYESGLAHGYGDGLFGPADSITREQLALMFHRYAGMPDSDQSLADFSDSGEISPWAAQAMSWAVETGLMKGRGGGIIVPKSPATRAELAQMLMNFSEITAE